MEVPPARSADSGDDGVAAACGQAGPTSTSVPSISVAPDGVIIVHDSPMAVRGLTDAMRDCHDRGKRTFYLGMATLIAQELYAHRYGDWMPMWLGPKHSIIETPFVPFAIPEFAGAEIERLAVLTAATGWRHGDEAALRLAASVAGSGEALPQMAAIAEILGDTTTLTAIMKSPVPANYLAGVVRKKIRAELIHARQKRMVALDEDLIGGMADAVDARAGIDVKEYVRDLRASGKPGDFRLAEALQRHIEGATKQELGDAAYQAIRYHLKQPRARAIGNRARREFMETGRGVMAPPTWFYTHAGDKRSAWHRQNSGLLR
jgi:hypothetical protein